LLDGIDLRAVRRTTMWQPTTRKTARGGSTFESRRDQS
jgi:hypothetical protein